MSKDNTCPGCGISWTMPVHGVCSARFSSGQQEYVNNPPKTYEEKQQDKLKPYKPSQQEGNTGHPTAETPDAQPLDEIDRLVAKQKSEVHQLFIDMDALGHLDVFGRDLGQEALDAAYKAIDKQAQKNILQVKQSNNASESDQLPSPSEQEDKPTSYSEAAQLTDEQVKYLDSIKVPAGVDIHSTDSKPEKPDQLMEILSNLPEVEQEPYYEAIEALISQREQEAFERAKKFWYYAGRWHYAECDFLLYDRGVCNCPGARKIISELKGQTNG